jgi:hypothetical protein
MEIKTKFNIGDKVWIMYENCVNECIIFAVDVRVFQEKIKIYYMCRTKEDINNRALEKWLRDCKTNITEWDKIFAESNCFATKEELLASL